MVKKITIICSDRAGIYARQLRNAISLKKQGYSVKILSWDRTERQDSVEEIEGINVHNFSHKPLGSSNLLLFTTGYLHWWLYVFFSLIKDNSDVIHAESFYSLFPLIPLKIFKDTKIIYDLVDFVADSYPYPEFVLKFLRFFENGCLKFTDGVIVVDMRKQKLKMNHIKKLAVVTNCPIDNQKFKYKKESKKETFIGYYGGWLSETRGIRPFCDSVKCLKNVKLIIAGSGPDEQKLKDDFSDCENIEFIGLVDSNASLELTHSADFLFAFYDPSLKVNRNASPAKLYDAMMCGTPIIVNVEARLVAKTVREENCGVVIPYDDKILIKKSLEEFITNPGLRMELGRNGRRAFEKKYNWNKMEINLLKIYDSL